MARQRHANAARDLADLLKHASPDVAAANAHVADALAADVRAELHAAYRLVDARAGKPAGGAAPSEHEEQAGNLAAQFEYLWQVRQGPELVREYRFHHLRKWRFDYYHEPTKTGIELEGGLYSGGRHTRAAGYQGDIEKYNDAAMRGITVLRLGTGQVDHQHVAEIIEYVKRKMIALQGE
mgnify:CR=1 FL=1